MTQNTKNVPETQKIKVKYCDCDDSYVELWQVIGKKKYVGRMVDAIPGVWYSICDPLGYREPNSRIKDDVEFIICDERGRECFRDSNGKHAENFESMQLSCKKAAELIGAPLARDLTRWLSTFYTKEMQEKLEKTGIPGYIENWINRCNLVSEKKVANFSYAGIPMAIYELTYEHVYDSSITWKEYMAGRENTKEESGYYEYYYGCAHDKKEGPVLDIDKAKKALADAIVEEYGPERLYVLERNNTVYVRMNALGVAGMYLKKSGHYTEDDLKNLCETKPWKNVVFRDRDSLKSVAKDATYQYYTT